MLGPGTQKIIKCVLLSSVEFMMELDDRMKGFCQLLSESWVYSFSKEGCGRAVVEDEGVWTDGVHEPIVRINV